MIARLRIIEQVFLAVAAAIAAVPVARYSLHGMAGIPSWAGLNLPLSLAGLATATSLGFSLREKVRGSEKVSTALAVIAAVLAARGMADELHKAGAARGGAGSMLGLVGMTFLLLPIALMLQHLRTGILRYLQDAALFGAGWLAVGLVIGEVLRPTHMFGISTPLMVHPATIGLLALLTFVAFARRAEHGVLSIFLNRGLGGRIARLLLPIVLVLPAAREVLRSRMMQSGLLPQHYAAGILASLGTMIAIVLVVVVARQIRRLEIAIQDLSLRDELTGLYNLRGFQLLGEQALRVSHRSQVPFSILFVDVDNLKQINDREGHGTGSRLLVQAADFLKAQFRETDVVARIGGDEFAVAGHFTPEAIERAEGRLRNESEQETAGVQLRLSMGHASADPRQTETLADLLERADAAMYERKRRKKLQAI